MEAQVGCTIGAVVEGQLESGGYEDEVDGILQCLSESRPCSHWTRLSVDKFWSCWWTAELHQAAPVFTGNQSTRVKIVSASWHRRLGKREVNMISQQPGLPFFLPGSSKSRYQAGRH